MNTFQRYFIHFSLFTFSFIILLGILVFLDSDINATPFSVFLVLIAGFIYVIPMALLYSNNAELVQLEIPDTIDEQHYVMLEELIYIIRLS